MAAAVISAILQLFGLLFVGWLIRRLGYGTREDFDKLSRIAMDFFYPALIFHSVVSHLEPSRLLSLWSLPVLGLGIMIVGVTAGLLLRRGLASRDPDITRAFLHICAVNNYGFLPIFILEQTQGPEVLALFFLFNLGSTLGFWTLGILTLGGRADWPTTLRRLATPSLLTLPVAALAALAGAKSWLPDPLLRVIEKTGSLSVPLMILIIGATVQGVFQRQHLRDILYLTAVRLLVIPALLIGLLSLLPLPADVRLICIIVSLMPAAATAAVMTRLYGGHTEYAVAVTLLTTIASVATVPLALHFLM